MIKFRDLTKDSYVWVVFDLNWGKSMSYQYNCYPSEYEIMKCLVIENILDKEETYNYGDRWHDDIVTVNQNYLTILFDNIEYQRSYDDFYDNKVQMTFTAPYTKKGPNIEVFTEESEAKNYVKQLCNNHIDVINKKIEELKFKRSLLEKSIRKIDK